MKFKQFFSTFMIFFFVAICFAQQTKLSKQEASELRINVMISSEKKKSIKSEFIQLKHLDFLSNDIESIAKTSEISKVLDALKLTQDIERLNARKPRSGQSRLRGRSKKVGKSVLFVTVDATNLLQATGAIPGVEVRNVKDLSVLDLAPGSDASRLTVYSKSAIEEIGKIKSTHLKVMVKTQ